jgi:hemerythrin-like domain-containing protein
VCNYCGCRAIEPVAQLTAEHERIQNLSGDVRRAVSRAEFTTAATLLRELHDVLSVHDAVEELALYPAMARHTEYADKIGTMFDEHDDLDDVLETALGTAQTADPAAADWAAVLAGLEVLVEHIQREEYGLFPAAAIALDPEEWEHAAQVRSAVLAERRGGSATAASAREV